MARQPQHQALSQPQFIIQSGDVYYLTLSVWAYDPDAAGMTTEQSDAAKAIKARFERLKAAGALVAVEAPEEKMYMAIITEPH